MQVMLPEIERTHPPQKAKKYRLYHQYNLNQFLAKLLIDWNASGRYIFWRVIALYITNLCFIVAWHCSVVDRAFDDTLNISLAAWPPIRTSTGWHIDTKMGKITPSSVCRPDTLLSTRSSNNRLVFWFLFLLYLVFMNLSSLILALMWHILTQNWQPCAILSFRGNINQINTNNVNQKPKQMCKEIEPTHHKVGQLGGLFWDSYSW